jgi:hypothetical protein
LAVDAAVLAWVEDVEPPEVEAVDVVVEVLAVDELEEHAARPVAAARPIASHPAMARARRR